MSAHLQLELKESDVKLILVERERTKIAERKSGRNLVYWAHKMKVNPKLMAAVLGVGDSIIKQFRFRLKNFTLKTMKYQTC